MGERAKYTPGTFSWADLSTTDVDGAKAFYAALFGWSAEDNPVPGGGVYSMQSLAGAPVAAIAPQPEQQRAAGVPSMWNNYITVESADDAAARAAELGADVHAPPFDVMDVGRMAVIADPQGAFFMVWEPRAHIGAGLVNAPGALSWNELAAGDLDAAAAFYSQLFGWQVDDTEGMPQRYLRIQNADGHNNGGMREKMEQEPPHWLAYFGCDDAEASVAKVTDLGGSVIAPAFDIGVGKIAVVQDPQGAAFALFSGEMED